MLKTVTDYFFLKFAYIVAKIMVARNNVFSFHRQIILCVNHQAVWIAKLCQIRKEPSRKTKVEDQTATLINKFSCLTGKEVFLANAFYRI